MDKVNYYVATKEGNVVGFTGLYTLIDQPATAKAQTTSALRCQQFVARLRLERHRVDSTSGFAALTNKRIDQSMAFGAPLMIPIDLCNMALDQIMARQSKIKGVSEIHHERQDDVSY
jgi:hypothetical protein